MGQLLEISGIEITRRGVAGLLLLLSYIAGTSEIQSIHKLFHSHRHTIAHSAADEVNLCHRSIYHDSDITCGHATHVSAYEECAACDLFINADEILLPVNFLPQESMSTPVIEWSFISVRSHDPAYLQARAPPASLFA